MSPRKRLTPTLLCFLTVLCAASIAPPTARAQSNLKKIRLGIAATSVGFLPIYAAYHRGFFKDEGIDLEIILMLVFSQLVPEAIAAPGDFSVGKFDLTPFDFFPTEAAAEELFATIHEYVGWLNYYCRLHLFGT